MSIVLFILIGAVGGFILAKSMGGQAAATEAQRVQGQLKELYAENEKLRDQAKSAKREAEDLESQLNRLKRQSRENDEKNMDAEDAAADAKRKVRQLEAEMAQLKSDLSDWKAACASRDAEIENLKKQLNA